MLNFTTSPRRHGLYISDLSALLSISVSLTQYVLLVLPTASHTDVHRFLFNQA